MEDLSGDMEQKVTHPVIPEPRKRSAGWTLLFVGNQGRVIRIRNVRGLLITWLSFSTIALTAAVGLGFFYYDQSIQNKALEDALKLSREKMRALRDEKDILLTRVVVAESNRKLRNKGASAKPENVPVTDKETPETKLDTPPKSPLEGIEIKSSMAAASVSDTDTDNDPEAAETKTNPTPLEADPPTVVAIDDFYAIVEPEGNRVRIKYKIRNTDPSSNPISGRTFLILKTKEGDPENWLILPEVALQSGKPVRITNGRSFSITRFKTIRFKAPYQDAQTPFVVATILVYATNGELLLEQSFPLENDPREAPISG